MSAHTFMLGGAQTDFARNITREGESLLSLVREGVEGALEAARLEANDVEVIHVGNFVAERISNQGQLGGLVGEALPTLSGIPASRHEAACASGSMAILAAMSDLESGRYDVALVLGVELMRSVPAKESQAELACAAWVPNETEGVPFVWPTLFSKLGDVYAERHGLEREHLAWLAKNAFGNAKRSPLAQTRGWTLTDAHFSSDDTVNPRVAGRLRKHDCSQITDGAAAVVLVSNRWLERRGRRADASMMSRVAGWGHRTARMGFDTKLASAEGAALIFPHVRQAFDECLARAKVPDVFGLDAVEVHDCFTTTSYMTIDHMGITPPGENARAIDEGWLAMGSKLPLNPSGGLIGLGHPVGATGVRMLLDAHRQVTHTAGDSQVELARRVGTLNLGGTATTVASFVVERAAD